ncbi:spermidine synthase [Pseudomonas sp. A3.4]|nr:spermidine synthase [Atopomonas sediminilitoris]MCJ8169236.1 spermidine synthase [Atopomonas sediminilitoris]
MGEVESLLWDGNDAHGRLRVTQVGEYRYLVFGDECEQSCMYLPDPAWLEYDYTRGMLLGALLHQAPQEALFLGLGAGSLLHAAQQKLGVPSLRVLELREQVPELCRAYFQLERLHGLQVSLGAAADLIDQQLPADLVFMDLYGDEGPSAEHLNWGFLSACWQRLKPGGWLIINQWTAENGAPFAAPLLRGLFTRRYWECPVCEGNVLLWVPGPQTDAPDFDALQARVSAVQATLGYDLSRLLQGVRPAS